MPEFPNFLDVVTLELEPHGYRIIRPLRDVGVRLWLLVRDDEDGHRWELECCDKLAADTVELVVYKEHFSHRRVTPCCRFPVSQLETDRALVLKRPYVDGEPLCHCITRPTRLPSPQVTAIMPPLCVALRTAEALGATDVGAVLRNLYWTSDDRVLLDSVIDGPRRETRDRQRCIDALVSIEQPTTTAFRRAAARFYQRAVTGTFAELDSDQITALHAAKQLTDDELNQLRRLHATRDSVPWLDTHSRSRLRRPRIAIAVLASVAVITVVFRLSQNRPNDWQGPEYLLASESATIDTPAPPSAPPTPTDSSTESVDALTAAARESVRLAKAGRFDEARQRLALWAAEHGVDDDGGVALANAKSDIELITEDIFLEQMAVASALYEMSKDDDALRRLNFVIDVFPEPHRSLAVAKREQIREARLKQLVADVEQAEIVQRQRQYEKRVLSRIKQRRKQPFNSAVLRAIANARKTVQTQSGTFLLDCLTEIQQCENELRNSVINAYQRRKSSHILAQVQQAMSERFHGVVTSIDRQGVVIIRSDTVVEASWREFNVTELYQIFIHVLGGDRADEHIHYRLYQYCRGRMLTAEARRHRRQLTSDLWRERVRKYIPFEAVWQELMGDQ